MRVNDLVRMLMPTQKLLFAKLLVIIEIKMKHMLSESNIPQIPETIIVKGDSAQKRTAQIEASCRDVLEEM